MAYDRLHDDDGNWEWVQLRDGWAQYELLERMAICLESGVPKRIAGNLAAAQVGAGSYGMPTPAATWGAAPSAK